MKPTLEYMREYESLVAKTKELENHMRHVSTESEISEAMTKLVDTFCLNINELRDLKQKNISEYFETYSKIQLLKAAAKNIMSFMDLNFNKSMKTFVSQTTLSDLLREEHQLIDMFTKTSARAAGLEIEVAAAFTAEIVEMCGEDVAELQKTFRSMPQSVALYKSVMNALIRKFNKENKHNISNTIITLVDSDKEWILTRDREKSVAEIPMTGFGLIPLHPSKPLSEVSHMLELEADSIDKLASELNSQDLELIVINRVINFPVEYNSFNILNKKVENLEGVNKKMVDEYRTITIENNKFNWNFNIDHYAAIGQQVVVLVRTSDKYAIMSTFVGGSKKLYKSTVEKLYNFIKKQQPQKRSSYNEKIIEKAKKSMFLDVRFQIDENFGRSFDLRPTINDIYMSLVESFGTNFSQKIASNKSDLREHFVNLKYKKIFDDALTLQFHEHFKKNLFEINNDLIGEVFTTFQYQLQAVSRSFYKELGDKFNFVKSNDANEIKDLFATIVMKLLNKLVGGETNLFNAVYQLSLIHI
jgi:hypothetical protein